MKDYVKQLRESLDKMTPEENKHLTKRYARVWNAS